MRKVELLVDFFWLYCYAWRVLAQHGALSLITQV